MRGIRLSRNFGQHRAIRAGLDARAGDYVVVMDCDLQDDPKYIADLLDEAHGRQGHRVHVQAPAPSLVSYATRRRSAYFRVYNALIGDAEQVARMGIGSYSILTRKVVNEYRRLPDVHAHYLINLQSLGFDHSLLEIEHHDRYAGKSSYTWAGWCITPSTGSSRNRSASSTSRSTIGLAFCALAALGIIGLVVNYMLRGALAGYTSWRCCCCDAGPDHVVDRR